MIVAIILLSAALIFTIHRARSNKLDFKKVLVAYGKAVKLAEAQGEALNKTQKALTETTDRLVAQYERTIKAEQRHLEDLKEIEGKVDLDLNTALVKTPCGKWVN